MNLTALALEKRQFTVLLIVAIFLAGIGAYKVIPQAQDPGFPIRVAQVITNFPGASPQRVEELVTDQLEKAIQEMPELDSVVSQSKSGISIVTVNIKDSYKDLRPVWDSLRRKVDSVQNRLPAEAQTSMVNDEYGDVFGIVISIVGDGFNYAELKDIADEVRDEFLRLPLVGKVGIYGEQQEQIFVEYNNTQLNELGLSPAYLKDFLSNKNIILSGGSFRTHYEEIGIEPTGNLESLEALRKTYIPLPDSNEVFPLGNIAKISRGYASPPKSKVHSNGENGLTLAISMIEGGNIVLLGEQVKESLNQLQEFYPWGVTFDVVAFQPELVERTVSSFMGNLLQAIAVVSAVMLFTLGLRTGLVVASLIPVTIAASVAVMYNLDIGLDQVSLAALMIALGMLVDNSIVMAESIMTRMDGGESATDAALATSNELRLPLLISSLTTAAAFLPIYLAESTTGEYTAPIFEVVSITLLGSWLFSLTLIPLLCVLFLKAKLPSSNVKSGGMMQAMEQRYGTWLAWMLRYRAVTISVVVGFFILALFSFRYVPTIFFPPSEDPTFKLEITLPVGTPIAKTTKVASGIEAHLQTLLEKPEKPGLTNWNVFIGNGGPRYVLSHSSSSASPNYAFFILNSTDAEVIDSLMKSIDDYIFSHYPDTTYSLRRLANGAVINNPIEVRISGTETDQLFALAAEIKSKLSSISGVKGIKDDWGRQTKKLVVDIDEAQAQRLGISNADVANTLQATSSGVPISEFREGENLIPILLKASSLHRGELEMPTSINILTADMQSHPMSQIVGTRLSWQPAVIFRRDRLKTITIASDLESGVTASEINQQLTPWLAQQQQDWPIGYRWELGGEAETSGDANASIFEKLPLAIVAIVLLLMGQFNCLRKTSIILLTIPLGLIGVAFGLNVAGSYMGFMTLLGIISLAGIVINNAIVLIDRIQIEQDETGLQPYQAVYTAAQKRLRPILLTTATTVVGMIPLWLGGGVMWEPMAVAIIFGLLGATVLTLGVVPVLYSLFFRVKPPETLV